MVVIPLVGPADDHDGKVLARVDAVVVDRRLEEVPVFREPFREIERCGDGHGGGSGSSDDCLCGMYGTWMWAAGAG